MRRFTKLVVCVCVLFVGGRVGWQYGHSGYDRAVTWWKGKPKVPTTALCHQILGELAVQDNWELYSGTGTETRALCHLPDRRLIIRLKTDWNGKVVHEKTHVYMNGDEIDTFEGDDLELIEAAADPVTRGLKEAILARNQAELRNLFKKPEGVKE